MRVIRNTGQNISPSDDGRLFDQAFSDGLFNSPTISSLGANVVSVGALYGILCGRDFTADAQQIDVILPESGTTTGYIYIKYDTATADIITIESALSPFTPTHDDINTNGTICEMVIATYTASAVAVTSLTANYPVATTHATAANVTYNSTNVADALTALNNSKANIQSETIKNPTIRWGIADNTDNDSFPRVEIRRSGGTGEAGVSFVRYDSNNAAKFSNIYDKNGVFLPDLVKIRGIEIVSVSYMSQVADKASATVTGTVTNVSGASTYYMIPLSCNFGIYTSNFTKSGTTISATAMNVSGATHSLLGYVFVIAVE